MLGRKSQVVNLTVNKYYFIRVQANKNNGICDLHLVSHDNTRRLSEILTDFQGRQYDDPYVREHLVNVVREIVEK